MKQYEGGQEKCTCKQLGAWGLTVEQFKQGHDCRYVYHHMAVCDNPVHPRE